MEHIEFGNNNNKIIMEHNLHIYELVLLFLGAFLFLILSGGLIYYIVKNQEIKKLLFFFPIPFLMMAYPSIKEVNISSDKIELSKYQEQYEENPQDTEALEKIEELTEELEPRVSSEEDLVQISKSNILLEKPEKAIAAVNKIIEKRRNESGSSYGVDESSIQEEDNYLKEAYQLKELAVIQQEILKEKDTKGVALKLNNLKLNPELTKVSSVVKRRAKLADNVYTSSQKNEEKKYLNLTGYWKDTNLGGRYYFNHQSSGSLSFTEYSWLDGNWYTTASGTGTIDDKTITIPYSTYIGTNGQFTGTVSNNGLQMKITARDLNTGGQVVLNLEKE